MPVKAFLSTVAQLLIFGVFVACYVAFIIPISLIAGLLWVERK